jgi:hypothetical protein
MDNLKQLHPNGLFLRREALAFGYQDRDLTRAVRTGVLHRVRHGTYVTMEAWEQADAVARHLLRAQGVALTHEHRVALSHTTGALAHGLLMWEPDLRRIHVTRLASTTARRETDVTYHRDCWKPDEIYAQDELLLMDATRCALGAAALSTLEGAVTILDSLLDLDLGDEESVAATYGQMRRGAFTRKLQIAVRLARRGAQSVGESRTRHLFWVYHLPAPVLQYEVYDGDRLVGITDFAWPEHDLLGEFDGKTKYGRLLKPGETPGDAVFREKKREDELRDVTGMRMIRYTYGDLYVPRTTAERTRRRLAVPDGARLRDPN